MLVEWTNKIKNGISSLLYGRRNQSSTDIKIYNKKIEESIKRYNASEIAWRKLYDFTVKNT
jgi:hypothetical protein